MNEIVSMFILAGKKFTPEMNFRQFAAPILLGKPGKPGFIYNPSGPFSKNKKRNEKI